MSTYRRTPWPLVALAWALAALAAAWFTEANAGTYPAKLLRVIDGDTYEMILYVYPDEQRRANVRLYGYDTPELRGACEQERSLAVTAKQRAVMWFAEHAQHVEVTIDAVDNFGRPLGVVESDGERLGEVLAGQGLARRFQRGRNEGWCDE